MLLKNTAGQRIHVYAYNSTTGAPKTGDAANITAYVSLDGLANAIDDTNPAEVDATNMPGIYAFDLTAAETNCDAFALFAKSATPNIRLEPIIGFTDGLSEFIKAKTDLIITGTTTIVSPVSLNGSRLTLVRGDDYTTASGQTITITDSGSTWPDLTGATVTLTIRNVQTDAVELSVAGTVVDPGTATQDVRFQPTAADTDALSPGNGTGKWDIEAVLASSNAVRTLGYGKVTVIEDQTRAA